MRHQFPSPLHNVPWDRFCGTYYSVPIQHRLSAFLCVSSMRAPPWTGQWKTKSGLPFPQDLGMRWVTAEMCGHTQYDQNIWRMFKFFRCIRRKDTLPFISLRIFPFCLKTFVPFFLPLSEAIQEDLFPEGLFQV